MINFELYFPTRVFFGQNQFDNLSKSLKRFPKKAFIVLGDDAAEKAGILKKILDLLTALNIESSIFRKIDAKAQTIDKAAKEAKSFDARFIIAIGNGEVIDAAKGVSVSMQGEFSIWDFTTTKKNKKKKLPTTIPIVAIPTVSTSYAHTDSLGVIKNKKEKQIIEGENLFPKMAFVDPEIAMISNPKVTAGGGIYVIAEVLEKYLSGVGEAPLQDRIAISIIRSIMDYLPRVIKNPLDIAAHSHLFSASTLAGSGILAGRDGDTPIQYIDFALTSHLKLAYGKGPAVLIPAMMKHDLQLISGKLVYMGKELFGLTTTGNLEQDAKAAIRAFEVFFESIGFSNFIDGESLDKAENIETIKDEILNLYGDKKTLANVRPIDRKSLDFIFEQIILKI